ncbi:myomesin-2 isoform X2 [Rhinatrema bivittatum]|uniref:myomesin-2 isoform X2 n=1 Tax=Rhinatrema bivittatum TaxID=194408 RepID=UPI0011299E2A|nr:myomesin-2 isoform X2 [Rhinatrema bivittatum]
MPTRKIPFYQRKHKHFDYSYRNIQSRYVVQEYTTKKTSASTRMHTDSSYICRLCHRKYVHSSAEKEAVEYTVSAFKKRAQEQQSQHSEGVWYIMELAYLQEEICKARAAARAQLDKVTIQRMVEEKMAMLKRYIPKESISRAPEILVQLTSCTVWEKMSVKLFFTVQGFPAPVVQWYKDENLINKASAPGKYIIESLYGVNILEINRAGINDTAIYKAVATNIHGQASTYAVVIVRRFREDEEHSVLLPVSLPLLPAISFTHIDIQFLEKFGVTFATECETLSLTCTLLITPELRRLHPQAEWYRDNVLIKESKWTQLLFHRGRAVLMFTHLNKDDEGLYTLRIITKGDVNQYSAYLFVGDAEALVAGAPGAPMDVECHDANKDYAIITWKPPNTVNEAPVIGYFVERCEVGTGNWIQCNDAPVKICKYPVRELNEGQSYIFRVRAVNNAGISRPSRISEAVAALDPSALAMPMTIHTDQGKPIALSQDDLKGDFKIPGAPTNVHASETSKTYVVLSWDPPVPCGREPLAYYVEKSLVGSESWQRVNSQVPVRSPRYAVFDLVDGKSYNFRVLSVNKFGTSEPSEVTADIQARDCLDVPSAPYQIMATRNTKTSVVVQWDKPVQEENLFGYYIESSVVGSNHWEPSNHKPINYNRFVVHGLTTGEKYIFRVKAVNAVGFSETSKESSAIKVQAALASPSSPYGITLLSCDGHSMTLGWKTPHFSGGSKITGYFIDKREDGHLNWHEANVHQIKERIYKIEELTEGSFYEFKISANNLAGLGLPSDPSELFKCEAWTMAEPGPSYDLTFCEVRKSSLVILWKAPVYIGKGPVTGYFVDYKGTDSEAWTTVNEKTTEKCYLKVAGLEEGKTYVFRIRAVNDAGVGKPSETSEPVLLQTRPGTKEISAAVDEGGNIYLEFECKEMTDMSQFTWCKSYEEITDDLRFHVETLGENSKLYFKNPDKVDLGTYSVSVSDTKGISSSYKLDADELEYLLALSKETRNPTIPLKSELAYEIIDQGQVRFWLQAENLSSDAKFRFVINDSEITDSESHRIKYDKSTGIIEMVMDKFTAENQGTYTVQIQDGKAKSQSSLVLIGDAFKALLAEAEIQRKEYLRKQGPYFLEYLSWDVTEACNVVLMCKVANTKKETVFKWYKDGVHFEAEELPDLQKGVCRLLIPKLSKKIQGVYKATLTDERGEDVSTIDIGNKDFEAMIFAISRVSGLSASELKIHSTAEGIRLECFMKCYAEEMKTSWYHKDSKISSSEKMRIGGTDDCAWMQITEPTEKDKGKYSFQIFDGKENYKREVDLSGQVFAEAFTEFQRLKQAAFTENNRGRVTGGLPDVVTIMEGKTLSLTCTLSGNPNPEVVWLKNDRDLEVNEHYAVTLEEGKSASLTIKKVSLDDSGKYGINVKNQHGGETVDVTVSVYKFGEEMPDVSKLASKKATPRTAAPS